MDVVAVLDGAGSVTNRYLHGPGIDQVFADERLGGEVLWALSDNLGSVRDWVQRDDQTGVTSVVEHLEYDAYGNIISHTNGSGQAVTNDAFFAFTGREWDADADLYFYRARWYDPGIGRFISEDPLGFGAGDVNVQRYVGNNPVNFTDPSGMISVAIADEHGSIIYGLDYFDQMTPAERSSLNSQMWNARLSDWLSSEAEMYEKFGIPVIRVKNPAAEFAAQQSQSGGNWGDMFNVLSTVVNSSLASVAIKPNMSAPAMAQAGPAQNPVCPPPHTDMVECAGWSVADIALDGLSWFDAPSAGIASNLTFGWSNTLRAELYGEVATRNHQGVMYNVGYWIGAGLGIGMGLGASGYLPGAGWAVSAAARYTTVATVYAFGQSSVNLATGRFHWTDTFGFLPAIGWGAGKMLRSPNVAAKAMRGAPTNLGPVGSKAPHQVTPGIRELEGHYIDDLSRSQPWRAFYDGYGRLIGRTDYNAGNRAAGIPDIHYHTYRWGRGMNPLETGSHLPGEFTP